MRLIVDDLKHTLPTRLATVLARRWFGSHVDEAYRLTLLTPAF